MAASRVSSARFYNTATRTSRDAWLSLKKRYASQSQNRILQLRNELLNTKGEGLSISDFVDRINHLADNLALAGKPLEDDELVTIVINNVGPAYESIVSSTLARDTSISYDDFVALLLSVELRLKSHTLPAMEAPPTALYAPKTRASTPLGRGTMNNWGSQSRGRGRGRSYSQSSFKFGYQGNNNPCQICGGTSHSAINCYERMNQAYEGRVPTKKLAAMAATTSANRNSTTWITDMGASNHITPDIANLTLHDEYHCTDQAAVGNGAGPQDWEDAFPQTE